MKERRLFLQAVAAGVISSLLIESWKTIFPSKDTGEVDKELWKNLFSEHSPPSIYAGQGNPLGLLDNGVQKLSTYLHFSSSEFSNYIPKVMNLTPILSKNNISDEFNYHPDKSALFLGGPISNDVVKQLLGYKDILVERNGKSIKMPRPIQGNKRIRWGQLHGEEGFGIYNGKLETAKRYDDGELVERAIYKLIDKQSNSIITPSVNKNGFLENEWLTIVKLKEFNSTKVIIGGMHGYSTEAFSREITKNLEELIKRTKKLDQYQVIVPVNLTHHAKGLIKFYTRGELDWKYAKIQEVFSL